MAATKTSPSIDLSLLNLDSAAIAAICNLVTVWIQTTPPEQHARNHARAERFLTFIEEQVFWLAPV